MVSVRYLNNLPSKKMGEWKNYLVYTKRERQAIVILLSITIILLAIPHLFEPPLVPASRGLQEAIVTVPNEDSPALVRSTTESGRLPASPAVQSPRLFLFDPNKAGKEELLSLGIPEKAAAVVMHYREKGGKFRRPEDLGKIYSIRPDLYQRLLPYVRISSDKPAGFSHSASGDGGKATYRLSSNVAKPIDINLSNQADWESLPGIGAKLAVRILTFREKLGGFMNVGQVGETYGLSDSAFGVLKPLLTCANPAVRQVDLNTVTIDELKQHPYFRGRIAYAIIRYREQHGQFKSLDDLRQLQVLDENERRKIEPYVVIKSG